MPEDTEEVRERMDQMLGEVERVLRLGGRFVTISLLQPHILHYLVHWSLAQGWPIR
jgi:ubiquinone/menaquinone biosynthesis C-methylase UbiE